MDCLVRSTEGILRRKRFIVSSDKSNTGTKIKNEVLPERSVKTPRTMKDFVVTSALGQRYDVTLTTSEGTTETDKTNSQIHQGHSDHSLNGSSDSVNGDLQFLLE